MFPSYKCMVLYCYHIVVGVVRRYLFPDNKFGLSVWFPGTFVLNSFYINSGIYSGVARNLNSSHNNHDDRINDVWTVLSSDIKNLVSTPNLLSHN